MMSRWGLHRSLALAFFFVLVESGRALSQPAPAPSSQIQSLDLAGPFKTRSNWRLVVTQGVPSVDALGDPAPGFIRTCLEKGPAATCISDPVAAPPPGDREGAWEAHYLRVAKPVYPRGPSAAPLLLVQTASLQAFDGNQGVFTQLLKYDRANDRFERVYGYVTGTNNNQEVRFIRDGPLEGSVILVDPTSNAPYAYWVTVNQFTSADVYRQALRYRSATRYNDGNPLAVIDSEMPNIERRLGLWKPGAPLPLPSHAAKPCVRPHLKNTELWCG
jgi:hypothetical protein